MSTPACAARHQSINHFVSLDIPGANMSSLANFHMHGCAYTQPQGPLPRPRYSRTGVCVCALMPIVSTASDRIPMRMNSCRSCVFPALAGGSTLPAFVSATRKHADVCAHVARTSGLRSSEVSPSSPSCPCATARVHHGFRPRDRARRNRLLCLSFCCGDPRRDRRG